jgi:hypothetical protein
MAQAKGGGSSLETSSVLSGYQKRQKLVTEQLLAYKNRLLSVKLA